MHPPIFALLIGIDHYASPTVPDLGGCVNDIEAMANVLQSTFHTPAAHIMLLRNEEATVAAVKSAFRQHLLEQVRHHVQGASSSDQAPAILFHFSGHGSQATDPTGQKPSGLDETLVCHDSRVPGIFDLKDWELGQLLDELGAYTDNITVILDCCHSGSGTRLGKQMAAKPVVNVRGCDADRRTQPLELAAETEARQPVSPTATAARGHANHVLLAACLNKEKAYEYVPPTDASRVGEGEGDVDSRQQRHGALTYFLLQALRNLDPTQLPTYYELYEQLRPQIADRFPQTVQCEGDWGRLIFGTARPDRDLWLTVVERRGSTWVVNGGAIHGINVGTRFHAYAPTARTLEDAGPRLGILEVYYVGVAQSDCHLIDGGDVPLHARLEADLATLLTQRRTLAVDVGYTQIATTVRARLAQADMAPLIALSPAADAADLRLTLLGREFVILTADGSQVGPAYPMHELNPRRRPFTPADFDPIAAALKRIVRVQAIAALENLGSPLADALAVDFKQLTIDPTTGRQTFVTLPESADDVPQLASGTPFVLDVTNGYLEALYIGVLLINAAWTVDQLYPELHGTHVMLASGKTLRVGMDGGQAQGITLTLNAQQLPDQAAGGNSAGETVTLLLIATKQETDFESLLHRETALAARLRLQLQTPKRDFKFIPEVDPADEWLIKRLRLQVVPPSQQ